MLEQYSLCEVKDLNPGDVIVHNYAKFMIIKCGQGTGAGSFDFGNYFWIEGYYTSSQRDEEGLIIFWSYEACPMIKCEG